MVRDEGEFRGLHSPSMRLWRGSPIHPMEEARRFFDGEGPVPETLRRLAERLGAAGMQKDWADVIELMRVDHLDETFADKLHPVTRSAYLQCHDQKLEEDRYNPEIDDPPAE